MDFKQLEIFIEVAKHKSFSKAAREMFLTQPTVSSHIQNLEKELGTVLINRSNKTITLTKSGEILYKHAIYILNNCKRAMYDIKEYSGKIEGVISLACSSIPETYILPHFLKEFSNSYSDVKFNISHYDSQDAIDAILDEKISFGFVGTKINNPHIEYLDLINDEVVVITPKNYFSDASDGYINYTDILGCNVIMRKEGSGTRKLVLNNLKQNNIYLDDFNVIAHVESNESIKEMVKIGLGLSFVSLTSLSKCNDLDNLSFYRIKDIPFKRNFYFIYSSKKALTPLEDKFSKSVYAYFNIQNDYIKKSLY